MACERDLSYDLEHLLLTKLAADTGCGVLLLAQARVVASCNVIVS